MLVDATITNQLIKRTSVPNALHVLEQYLLPATIIEFGSTAISVPDDSLDGLQGPVIFQKMVIPVARNESGE